MALVAQTQLHHALIQPLRRATRLKGHHSRAIVAFEEPRLDIGAGHGETLDGPGLMQEARVIDRHLEAHLRRPLQTEMLREGATIPGHAAFEGLTPEF